MAKKSAQTASLLSHPLIGKRVSASVAADNAVGRTATTLHGTLTSYDGNVLCISKRWWFTSSVQNMKEN